MKNKMNLVLIVLGVIAIGGVIFRVLQNTSYEKPKVVSVKAVKKVDLTKNYTVNYVLNHFDSYEAFLEDNHPIQWVLSEKTYVLKGDGSSKHAGGYTFKTTKGNMIESGHERGKIDYIVTTDNKDVTTLGAIKQAFAEKNG